MSVRTQHVPLCERSELSHTGLFLLSFTVKRYVRKGIPNEHRALIWMATSGAQDQLEKNPGRYQSLLRAQHDPKLAETINTGGTLDCLSLVQLFTQTSLL